MVQPVLITNPEFVSYYTAEQARRVIEHPLLVTYYTQENAWRVANNAREISLQTETIAQIALQTAQLIAYYDAADDAIDDRDDKIDAQIVFMQQLEDLNINQDLPMIEDKADVLTDLQLPIPFFCGFDFNVAFMPFFDGEGVDLKSQHLALESCSGVPNGWDLDEGNVQQSKAGSNLISITSASDVRRIENFRRSKTSLVRTAQIGLKSTFNAGDTLSKYAQAAAIHSGFADLYIQGFNSAGAGLGVALGKLNTGSTDQNSGGSTSNTSGANTGANAGTTGATISQGPP